MRLKVPLDNAGNCPHDFIAAFHFGPASSSAWLPTIALQPAGQGGTAP
jgi:hypothetical protein